jgi:hypothetical protein
VRTARASGSAGSVAGYRTSSGGSAVVARGDNNVYVGKDGQLYRRTADGWDRYDGGQWSGAGRSDPATVQSLDRDAQLRSTGASRSSQAQAWRASGGSVGARAGGMRGGGGGRRR